MTSIRSFESFEEMQEMLRQDKLFADAATRPWQAEIKIGDFFVRVAPEYGVVIYGEILDPVQGEIDSGASEEEVEYVKQHYIGPHRKNMQFTRSFSQLCPEGELGDIHVCTVTAKLTKDQFEQARKDRWPVDPRYLINTLQVQAPE